MRFTKKRRKIFLFLLLFVLSGIVISQGSVWAYEKITGSNISFAKGTKLAGISIGGLSYEKAYEKVDNKVKEWQQSGHLTFSYDKEEVLLDRSVVVFHLKESLKRAETQKNESLIVDINKDKLYGDLYNQVTAEDQKKVNKKSLEKTIADQSQRLATKTLFVLQSYIKETEPLEETVVAEVERPLSKESKENLSELFGSSSSWTVGSKDEFSFNYAVLTQYEESFLQESREVLTSSLYEAMLHTDFAITERHISTTRQNHVPLGYEAYVSLGKEDLTFENPHSTSYVITVKVVDNKLITTVSGKQLNKKIEVKERRKETYPPRTIVEYDPLLNVNETRIERTGKPGESIEVARYITNGKEDQVVEVMNNDYYPPVFSKEVRGPKEERDVNNTE
ncbi:VanW family protein [Priestia endophytica]|uniref:VanW family protein n=1 Tax=Priestia endophytica TaxID=135735 RepID=UPI003D2E6875